MLFISTRDVNKKSDGGFQCTNRNYLSFCELIGKENVGVLQLEVELEVNQETNINRLTKWLNYLRGFGPGVTNSTIRRIIASSNDKDLVFIDTSQFGVIAYYLKKAGYKGTIVSFFHNIEFNIKRQAVKINILNFWRLILIYYNEKKAVKYSDKIVVLNKRDNAELQKRYKTKNNIYIIPISLSDTLRLNEKQFKTTSNPPTILFIGNKWYANIHGLDWFVKNVLDHVDIKLQVVGTGMDVLKVKYIHPKIEFLGYVPDLSFVLLNADYVICPIFLGSGMKVKTCEALMYGKNIIGTKEAFEGYDIDYQKVGAMCNNKEEFVNTLNHYCSVKREKFNDYSRNCFVDNYSFQATLIKFDELLLK
jgi:hypothetical protein